MQQHFNCGHTKEKEVWAEEHMIHRIKGIVRMMNNINATEVTIETGETLAPENKDSIITLVKSRFNKAVNIFITAV